MRRYELMVILDPELEERTVAPSLETYLKIIKESGGTVDKLDIWGRRRMSFEINKKPEGIYAVVDMHCGPDAIKELVILSPMNLKFLSVFSDLKLL